MKLIIYICYWLLFSKNNNFKYTRASQRLTFNSFWLFYIVLSHRFLSYGLFSNSHAQRNIVFIIYITYRILWEFALVYYLVSEICIGGHSLEECFCCYFQQIKSAVDNESLILYNLIKNLAHILNNLKTFKEAIMWHLWICEYDVIFYWSHHMSVFSAGNLDFTCFVRFQTLVLFLLWFSAFCEFQCHFYKNTFNIYYEIFYFILVWRGLKSIKLETCFFFYPPPTKLQYKIIHSCNYA